MVRKSYSIEKHNSKRSVDSRNLIKVLFVVNAKTVSEYVSPNMRLLDFLRDRLELTGTKDGCSKGECGACTILVDGIARKSCLIKMSDIVGKKVETIESLVQENGKLHPIQYAFINFNAAQCGFCTPGMIMAAKGLLDKNPNPSRAEIESALRGNLCRCTGYVSILEALKSAGGMLSCGKKISKTLQKAPADETFVGDSPAAKELISKVTGSLKFSADLNPDNLLYGQLLLANTPHAEILSIDISSAEKLNGVHKIITSKDIKGLNLYGGNHPVIAEKKVRFLGDIVAVVFADTKETARKAISRISVEYNLLPIVSAPSEGLRPNAPLIHESGNIAGKTVIRKGDIKRGFKKASVIVEGEFNTPFVEHGYLEPEAGVAIPEPEGGITVFVGTQTPFRLRKEIAASLNLPEEKIRVIGMPMGGAFGGKLDFTIEIILALGALLTQRPVKIVLSREASLRMSTKRHPFYMKYRIGATKEGKFIALQADLISDAGAYSGYSSSVMEKSVIFGGGPYFWPNALIEGKAVYTNNMLGGAFRGFGVNQVHFAVESLIDDLAYKLNLDPFEIRLLNALEKGMTTLTGEILEGSVSIKETLIEAKKAIESIPRLRKNPGKRIGLGVASGWKNIGIARGIDDKGGAIFKLNENGVVELTISAVDMGQGVKSSMTLLASQVTGINENKIEIQIGDTSTMIEGTQATSQRQTFIVGNAVLKAGERLKKSLLCFASNYFAVDERRLFIKGDMILDNENSKIIVSLGELYKIADNRGVEFKEAYEYHAPKTFPLIQNSNLMHSTVNSTIKNNKIKYRNYLSYSFGTQVAIVEVDEKKRNIKIKKLIMVHDVGKALDKKIIYGQLQGSAIMGIGYALSEEFVVHHGVNKTNRLGKCGILRLSSIPEKIDIVLVEKPDPYGPLGAKGISETGLVQTAPAISNAIFNACRIRINSLPLKKYLQGKEFPELKRKRNKKVKRKIRSTYKILR